MKGTSVLEQLTVHSALFYEATDIFLQQQMKTIGLNTLHTFTVALHKNKLIVKI